MSQYSKINFIYFMQKWMDSVPGQTFLNYAYSWGAAVVILGTLFKLTHLPGANLMLFIGMGTEVIVFFISAFDRPFDKTTIDMTLDNHMDEESIAAGTGTTIAVAGSGVVAETTGKVEGSREPGTTEVSGIPGTVIIGGGGVIGGGTIGGGVAGGSVAASEEEQPEVANAVIGAGKGGSITVAQPTGAPAPAVTQETANAMLSIDSEEMENLNRTLTGIARVYEMQLKSASQQITTQDSINEQTSIMASKIKELNGIYSRMIEAMTVNMPKI